MNQTIVGAEVAALATEIGEDTDRIQTRQIDWRNYLKEGVIVSLTVRRWRAKVQVQFADLGLQPSNEDERKAWERLMVLGSRYLLPKAILKEATSLESKARDTLEKYGLKTHWGRFIHKARYAEWRAEDAEIEAAYMKIAADIETNWDDLVDQVRRDYIILGLQNYNRLTQAGLSLGEPEEWVREFVGRAMRRLEPVEKVVASFAWERTVEYLPLASAVAADQAAADQTWMAARERARLEAEESMQADLIRTEARKAAEGIQTFSADLIAEIRTLVYDTVSGALSASDKNGGRLPRNSTKGLKTLVEKVERLKFWDDAELEGQLAQLAALVDTPSRQRNEDDVKSVLNRLADDSRYILLDLDRMPVRKAQELDLGDDLDDLEVAAPRNAAAEEIELDDIDDVATTGRSGGRSRDLALVG